MHGWDAWKVEAASHCLHTHAPEVFAKRAQASTDTTQKMCTIFLHEQIALNAFEIAVKRERGSADGDI